MAAIPNRPVIRVRDFGALSNLEESNIATPQQNGHSTVPLPKETTNVQHFTLSSDQQVTGATTSYAIVVPDGLVVSEGVPGLYLDAATGQYVIGTQTNGQFIVPPNVPQQQINTLPQQPTASLPLVLGQQTYPHPRSVVRHAAVQQRPPPPAYCASRPAFRAPNVVVSPNCAEPISQIKISNVRQLNEEPVQAKPPVKRSRPRKYPKTFKAHGVTLKHCSVVLKRLNGSPSTWPIDPWFTLKLSALQPQIPVTSGIEKSTPVPANSDTDVVLLVPNNNCYQQIVSPASQGQVKSFQGNFDIVQSRKGSNEERLHVTADTPVSKQNGMLNLNHSGGTCGVRKPETQRKDGPSSRKNVLLVRAPTAPGQRGTVLKFDRKNQTFGDSEVEGLQANQNAVSLVQGNDSGAHRLSEKSVPNAQKKPVAKQNGRSQRPIRPKEVHEPGKVQAPLPTHEIIGKFQQRCQERVPMSKPNGIRTEIPESAPLNYPFISSVLEPQITMTELIPNVSPPPPPQPNHETIDLESLLPRSTITNRPTIDLQSLLPKQNVTSEWQKTLNKKMGKSYPNRGSFTLSDLLPQDGPTTETSWDSDAIHEILRLNQELQKELGTLHPSEPVTGTPIRAEIVNPPSPPEFSPTIVNVTGADGHLPVVQNPRQFLVQPRATYSRTSDPPPVVNFPPSTAVRFQHSTPVIHPSTSVKVYPSPSVAHPSTSVRILPSPPVNNHPSTTKIQPTPAVSIQPSTSAKKQPPPSMNIRPSPPVKSRQTVDLESEWIDVEELDPYFPCSCCKTPMAPPEFWNKVKKARLACTKCEKDGKTYDGILKTLKTQLKKFEEDSDGDEISAGIGASRLLNLLTYRRNR